MSKKEDYSLDQVVKDAKGNMEYVALGSGTRVSKICLGLRYNQGCMSYGDKRWAPWVLDDQGTAMSLIEAAYNSGINFFDTANVYSNGVSEEILGKAIKKYNFNRNLIVVATKVYFTVTRDWERVMGKTSDEIDKLGYLNQHGLSRKHIFDSVEHSLQRLQLDYIDLLQIHRFDKNTPIKETMKALHDVVESGKVRYIGASSMYAHEFLEMQYIARMNNWTEFITMQNCYSAVYREEEREMFPSMAKFNVSSIPWSPIAGGYLARPADQAESTTRGQSWKIEHSEADVQVNKAIETIANARGINMAQVAIAWVLHNKQVTSPIVGISNARALDDAIKGSNLVLTDHEIKSIESPYKPKNIQGHQ